MIEESEENLEVTVALKLPYSRIADLICTGLEGGQPYATFSYNGYVNKESTKFWRGKRWEEFYAHINPALTKGSYVLLLDHYNVDDNREDRSVKVKRYKLGLPQIRKGLQIMASKYPHQFGLFMNEGEDAITGDVFLQCCLLGEVVYG